MPGEVGLLTDDAEGARLTHDIMASNFVLGPARFVVLDLPDRWRLETGRSLPEVNRTVPGDGPTWVVDGSSTLVMADPRALRAYELRFEASEGTPRDDPRLRFLGETVVGGHVAQLLGGDAGKGLLRRKTLPTLQITHRCSQTGRYLRIVVRGHLEVGDRDLFLECLRDLTCH